MYSDWQGSYSRVRVHLSPSSSDHEDGCHNGSYHAHQHQGYQHHSDLVRAWGKRKKALTNVSTLREFSPSQVCYQKHMLTHPTCTKGYK